MSSAEGAGVDRAGAGGGLALVAGAGEGLGAACLRRFSAAGFAAVGLSRSGGSASLADLDIRPCDLTDAAATRAAVDAAIAEHGPPTLVIHNTAMLIIKPFLELTPEEIEGSWRSMALSAANLAQACLPSMVAAGEGTLVFSGATASLRGGARFAALASPKFALRGLAQSLAREFQPQGIHVAHAVLDGIIDTPASRTRHGLDPARMMDAAAIAEAYLALHRQPRSVWTQELDLRPATETF